MRILVTGANGQVGHELLRALVGPTSPSVPLPAEGGRQAGTPQGEIEGKTHPLPHEGSRATVVGQFHPLPHEGSRATVVGQFHPLPQEGGRAAARGDVVIAATRTGTLDDGSACERVDLAKPDDLRQALDRIAPDLIINAAAYTAVDRAEDEPDIAQRVNADAVGVLGEWAAQHAARVIHYSTDYVFDGSAAKPYREDDPTHPLGVYGRSKLAGEKALRASAARHLIFRTAWVYGARGHNFLRTMLRLGAERDELRVVDDQIGAPTPARLIADITALAFARWYLPPSDGSGSTRSIGGRPALDGTYHLVTSGQTSWCGFARAIFERAVQAGLLTRIGSHPPRSPFVPKGEEERGSPSSLPPLPQDGGRRSAPGGCPRVVAITTADFPTKAVRPAYSVLDTTKLQTTFNMGLPDWQTALDEVIGELVAR